MAHSLAEECTPLKREYDSCFNAWFAGFLEPATTVASTERQAYIRMKKEEYEQKCGQVWKKYGECVQAALKARGLTEMLDQAQQENSLSHVSVSSGKKES